MNNPAKFKLGQKVFIMMQNMPVMVTVAAITETSDRWVYYIRNQTTYCASDYNTEKKRDFIKTHREDHIFESLDELKASLFGGE